MEISGLPIITPQPDLKTQIGVAVLSQSLDMIQALGDGMIKMLEQSVQPNLGGNVDITL